MFGDFLNFYYTLGLQQLANEPTKSEYNLDLVFRSDFSRILDVSIVEPLCTSAHNSIRFDVVRKIPSRNKKMFLFTTFNAQFGPNISNILTTLIPPTYFIVPAQRQTVLARSIHGY